MGFTTGVYSVGLTSVHTLPQYFPGIESKISLAVMERIINGQECWLPEGTRIYYKWPEWLPVGKKERIINFLNFVTNFHLSQVLSRSKYH